MAGDPHLPCFTPAMFHTCPQLIMELDLLTPQERANAKGPATSVTPPTDAPAGEAPQSHLSRETRA
eukprot:185468-Chlamydomonas_euryale.AAC.4